MRHLLIGTVLLVALSVGTGTASAEVICQAGAFRQDDMAGTYESATSRVVVYPCGGISILWRNDYGQHTALYSSVGRLEGNGIMARGVVPDPTFGGFVDESPYLGIKAAEPGYVQLVTYGPALDPYNMPVKGIYRLRKMS